MALVATRVLIINRQLSFSVRIKQALEQVGGFEVTPFTTADAALDHLRQRPHDVALVDFTLPGMSGIDIILRLRSIQPDIAILASPDVPDITEQVRVLKLNGVFDPSSGARELIPLIQDAITQMHDTLPDTTEAPALTDSETLIIEEASPGLPSFSSLDSVLIRLGGLDMPEGSETIDVDMRGAGYAEDDTDKDSQSIELVLTGNLSKLKDEPKKDPVFRQLAAEEPPLPSLEDGGTVSDLIESMGEADLQEVAEIMIRNQATPVSDSQLDDVDEDDTPAKMILQNALDDTSPLVISLDELLKNIEIQFPEDAEGVKPLPSWVRDIERYVREPDFLDTDMMLTLEEGYDSSVMTTQMHDLEAVEADPGNIETEVMRADQEAVQMVSPLPEDVEEPAPEPEPVLEEVEPPSSAELPPYAFEVEPEPGDVLESEPVSEVLGLAEEDEDEATSAAPVETRQAELPPYEFESETAAALDGEERSALETDLARSTSERAAAALATGEQARIVADDDDPHLAQLALSLTQASLELTAEATLLTLNNEIKAYAGALPFEDLEDLQELIDGDWEAKSGEARIRFITLPSSGQDYMLYSRQTDSGFSLSMVFAGNMPLRVIRRQSDRLVEALRHVPETPAEEPEAEFELEQLEQQVVLEEEAAQESKALLVTEQQQNDVEPTLETRTPYTYLWLVRDAEHTLTPEIAQAIVHDLDDHLVQKGWDVKTLNVYEDYVYLLADVPGEPLANEIVPELKQSSAQIAHAVDNTIDPASLWADSYCVLTPGRELRQDEIQHFINFGRAR